MRAEIAGPGYSSRAQRTLTLSGRILDALHIDGQFVHNIAHDQVDRGRVEAIAQIGRTRGIGTIAERVDSAEVLQRLADLGIEYAQGRYIAPPQPVEVLGSLLEDDTARARLRA